MNVKLVYNGKLFSKELQRKLIIDSKNDVVLSLADAAKVTGISKATLSRANWENKIDVDTLATLCLWMKLPMEKFFTKIKR